MRFFWLGVPAVIAAASCGAKVAVDPSSGAGGGTSGSGGAGGAAACGTDGVPIPAAYRPCATDADCAIGYRYVDCCGSQAAYGIAQSQLASFDAYEKKCDPVVPACQCAGKPTTAEDGKTSQQGTIAAQCSAAGACTSVVLQGG